ncbi:hypothetical protein SteCoe_14521 [Stentor coeruleus]|uniref:Uncharacterized protein n=1 Tax=Stentor coeruleus TaxID=5963 RepID=A0A1R2C5W4_9CILI|nr:hypothetical protein SteCoe_14521 [Stentor coeruleus]
MKGIKSIDPHCFENPSIKNINSRKVKAETKIRSQFISKGCRKFPKKEYIRCKLIRGHKRVLRQIMANETYVKDLIENTNYHSCKQVYWGLLVNTFLKYKNILSEIIPVEVGPVNEIMKRKKMRIEHLKRSFNAEFCQDYLEKIETRESYFYYVEFLFSDFDCEKLIKRFGFKCCNKEEHDSSCSLKWLLLKNYCSSIVLEDIDIEPYTPEEKFLPLPSIF